MDKYDITLILSCNSRSCKKNYSIQEVNTITQQNNDLLKIPQFPQGIMHFGVLVIGYGTVFPDNRIFVPLPK